MRTFKTALNGKGLLAASIAMLSGHALAETAGRVSFVTGDASVTGSDGNIRALKRGEAINGGDRITTRAGRVQIRFTDGGFVSLQPNTVFGVDEYLYTNRKPEETSLFFNLVQGGMRTITGAIGKVNKKSYQVRTPVATIGIRGTEYLAQVGERGLVVSVGSGFVNVANDRGEVTAGVRQNIRVTGQNAKPELSDEQADLLSTRTDGRERDRDDEEDGDRRTVTVSDVQNSRGDYLFLFTTRNSLEDSVPVAGPAYTLMGPTTASGYLYHADFDQSGAISGSEGGLLKLFDPVLESSQLGDVLFDSGTLKVVNSGTVGAVSWGEFTHGDAAANGVFSAQTNPLTLSDSEFLPYIIGKPAEVMLNKGFATYTLQGATPARDSISGEVGSIDSFVMKLNLDFGTLDAALDITMPTNHYTVSTLSSVSLASAGPVEVAFLGSGSSGFTLDSSQLVVTDSNGACASGSASGGCSANIDAFFAGIGGRQIATSYSLFNGSSSIQGVAALGLSALSANAPFLPDSSTGVQYRVGSPEMHSLAFALQNGAWASASFDQTGSTTGTVGGLRSVSFNTGQEFGSFDSGTLQVVNSGTTGGLTWGEFTNGSSSTNSVFECPDGCADPLTLDSSHFMPYVLGVTTNGNMGKGTATYTLSGKTPVRDVYTNRVGTLDHFIVRLNLDFASVEAGFRLSMPAVTIETGVATEPLAATISVPATTYTVQTHAPIALLNLGTADGFSLNSSHLAVTSSTGACAAPSASCYASLDAFFSGEASQQIGASYWLQDYTSPVSTYLNGVAALDMTAYNPNAVLASGPHYSLAYAAPQSTAVAGGFVDKSLTVTFDPAQLMTTATGFDPATSTSNATIMDRKLALAGDTGQAGALKWGRWYTAGLIPVTVTAGASDLALGNNESLHYIVGPMTQPNIFAGVVQAYGENATATYTYQGGSFATGSDGVLGSITAGSTLTMTFSSVAPTLGLDIGIDMQSGNDYQIDGFAQLGLDSTASKFSAISGSGASCALAGGGSGGCSASISGFFAGQQAQQIGLGYRVDDSSRVVNGAAAFARDTISPGLQP